MSVLLFGVVLFEFLCLFGVACSVRAGEATNGTPKDAAIDLATFWLNLRGERRGEAGAEWYYRFRERFERKAKTRLTFSLAGDFLEHELAREEVLPNDLAAKKGRKLLKDALRYTLREWAAETRLVQWLKEDFTDLIYDAISGREERHNLAGPLESDFAAQEEERWSRGIKKGIRPFRSNPYAYVSYGRPSQDGLLRFQSTLRFYLEKWSVPRVAFLNEVPIGKWRFGAGFIFDTDGADGAKEHERRAEAVPFLRDGRTFIASVGLNGPLLGGIAYAGADVTTGGFIVQYRRWWMHGNYPHLSPQSMIYCQGATAHGR